ncbi:hypothetical protein [Nocardia jejuensis]|uniref:hypothetical protein n=1 Tax=Nocardia jejuensis TaxID=328049 RepID=UPI00083731E4|nr:hypothetical protein [Nocardia jejuensis]
MTAAPAVASADIYLTDAAAVPTDNTDPMQAAVSFSAGTGSGSDSVKSGSAGGLATTGSTGTGSFGLPNLDKMLFGNFKTLCLVTGSVMPISGEASFGCGQVPSPI